MDPIGIKLETDVGLQSVIKLEEIEIKSEESTQNISQSTTEETAENGALGLCKLGEFESDLESQYKFITTAPLQDKDSPATIIIVNQPNAEESLLVINADASSRLDGSEHIISEQGSAEHVSSDHGASDASTVKSPEAISRKRKRKRSTASSNFPCTDCTESFERKVDLEKHQLYDHKEKHQFKCSECNQTYPNLHFLKEHWKYCHTYMEHFCYSCCKVNAFANEEEVMRHLAECHDKHGTEGTNQK